MNVSGSAWIGARSAETARSAVGEHQNFRRQAASVTVKINAFNPSGPTRDSLQGFVEGDGCVSIEAEHFTKNVDAGANRWIKIPDYGHTLSAMRADGPVDVQATPGKDSPCLEYKMYLFSTGKVEVESTVGPTLNFIPGRPLRYAVSFDDETPQVVTIVPANFNAQNGNRNWEESVRNNCRHVKSTHTISAPGYHTLENLDGGPGGRGGKNRRQHRRRQAQLSRPAGKFSPWRNSASFRPLKHAIPMKNKPILDGFQFLSRIAAFPSPA